LSLAAGQKIWSCPLKVGARKQTTIQLYRALFGKSVPKDKQYWSMCGQCSIDGTPLEDCELDQIVKTGLIKPHQFYGVEINPEIHNLNTQAWPESNWYCGDFYQAMDNADNKEKFNPAVVNADLITMPETSVNYLVDIFELLSTSATNVIFIVNFVLRSRYRMATIEDAIDKLNENNIFQSAIRSREWNYLDSYYSYAGSGQRANSNMSSMIFYLKD